MKQKDYRKMDAAILKGGLDHFFPNYEDGASQIAPEGNFRPTWYTQFHLADGGILYSMYENVKDLCLSTVYCDNGKAYTSMHTGYPKTQEEAEKFAKLVIKWCTEKG